jgi:Putative MetA-pathway of phenol degradation
VRTRAGHVVFFVLLIAVGAVAGARPSDAQSTIYRTRKSASSTWSPVLPLTIGSAFEFETNKERTEWGFPVLIQYNFTETLQMSLEPSFGHIKENTDDTHRVGGLGDLETSLDWEFLRERRWTPALGLEGTIRWPTASDPDLGDRNHDYSVGLVLSKDLALFELDSNVIYTFSGDREQPSGLEISIAAEYPLTRWLDLDAEFVQIIETGPGRSQRPREFTFGIGWHVNSFLTIEYGTELNSDGSWQQLLGWQYSFGGD